MTARYQCGDEGRRAAVRNSPTAWNGIDFLEVSPDQLTLSLHFLKAPAPAGITVNNVAIEGGVRITGVRAESVTYSGEIVEVSVNTPGDFSIYTLRLQDVADLDARLSAVKFSFKVACPSDFDCRPQVRSLAPQLTEPEIDYLAKDYASFRRLMLDRLSTIAPDWRERNPPDVGMALVELMAYVGDQLSYYQDAVATEAYLCTARKRTSIRRHARLVDYQMHEGCNARTWIQFEVKNPIVLPKGTRILTKQSNQPIVVPPSEATRVLAEGPFVFETMYEANLYPGYHELYFYTWSDRECCLPARATEATLVGPLPELHEDDVLVFEEVLGPKSGEEADADPAHRHVVRLTRVESTTDQLNGQAVVDIAWKETDALPFPLCISARTDEEHGAEFIENVSVARSNVVLTDHGQWLRDELDNIIAEEIGVVPTGGPFRPVLQRGPLTHAVPLPEDFRKQPVANLLHYQPREARPRVFLTVPTTGEIWHPQHDLLASDKFASEFVVEMEGDGRARLRFGDDVHGKRPAVGTAFTASYRIGCGQVGNVGAEALGRVITDETDIIRVRNPLTASGGHDPETLEEVLQFAPQAFRVQQRAVTEEDYARAAERHPEVQRAAATFRWTGSWHTAFVSIDRRAGLPVDADFERRIRDHLNFYRMAGYDLELDGPQFVPLDIAMTVCVKAGYFRSEVKEALLEKLSNRILPDGSRGFFHPDNWTFGQALYLSKLYAAVEKLDGVDSAMMTRFIGLYEDDPEPDRPATKRNMDRGYIPMSRLEIARLDNDPNFQENGRIELDMQGGK